MSGRERCTISTIRRRSAAPSARRARTPLRHDLRLRQLPGRAAVERTAVGDRVANRGAVTRPRRRRRLRLGRPRRRGRVRRGGRRSSTPVPRQPRLPLRERRRDRPQHPDRAGQRLDAPIREATSTTRGRIAGLGDFNGTTRAFILSPTAGFVHLHGSGSSGFARRGAAPRRRGLSVAGPRRPLPPRRDGRPARLLVVGTSNGVVPASRASTCRSCRSPSRPSYRARRLRRTLEFGQPADRHADLRPLPAEHLLARARGSLSTSPLVDPDFQ